VSKSFLLAHASTAPGTLRLFLVGGGALQVKAAVLKK
jgi:hypothetical protein